MNQTRVSMDIINAIAKVRFSSAQLQRVQITRAAGLACDLLCMEPGQELASDPSCLYYVIAGTGTLKSHGKVTPISIGHVIANDGAAGYIVNQSEQRLICLAVSQHGPAGSA